MRRGRRSRWDGWWVERSLGGFDLGEDVWQLAATSFAAYAIRRRRSGGGLAKRLPADFVIASHALLKADRFMTRDAGRYSLGFPNLRLI